MCVVCDSEVRTHIHHYAEQKLNIPQSQKRSIEQQHHACHEAGTKLRLCVYDELCVYTFWLVDVACVAIEQSI